MYIEFVVSYVFMGIIILMLVAVIVLLAIILKKMGTGSTSSMQFSSSPYSKNSQKPSGVVYCRNCATQYDASKGVCPKCGTTR